LLELEFLLIYNIKEGLAVSSLALAEDLLLLVDTRTIKNDLLAAEAYNDGLGINISGSKCAAF
jgi:hypothetical protein